MPRLDGTVSLAVYSTLVSSLLDCSTTFDAKLEVPDLNVSLETMNGSSALQSHARAGYSQTLEAWSKPAWLQDSAQDERYICEIASDFLYRRAWLFITPGHSADTERDHWNGGVGSMA